MFTSRFCACQHITMPWPTSRLDVTSAGASKQTPPRPAQTFFLHSGASSQADSIRREGGGMTQQQTQPLTVPTTMPAILLAAIMNSRLARGRK